MDQLKNLIDILHFQSLAYCKQDAFNFYEKGSLKSFSNQDLFDHSFAFACGLKESGFKKNDSLAIFCYQSPIWLIVYFGTLLAGGITVPIFHNISKENFSFQLNDASVSYIFTDKYDDFIRSKNHQKIITYQIEQITDGENHNQQNFKNLLEIGNQSIEEKKYSFQQMKTDIKPEDLATIIYTSGTTGNPKGVMLSHNNIISQVNSTSKLFPLKSGQDVALSCLPLAHIFELMVMLYYVSQGVFIYFADDIKNLGSLMKKIQPTIMTAVPRLLEKVFVKIKKLAEEKSIIKKLLLKTAIRRAVNKKTNLKPNFFDKILDKIIYKKFRQIFGNRIKLLICGGASLSNEVEAFYRNININLFCGYGLTETSAVVAVNYENNYRFGTVGKNFPGIELKIDEKQELLVKGKNVMIGYHNLNQETQEVIQDGWFKTGDLATIDNEGFVKITGRKKELFKNSNGKYVSPVPIENKLTQEIDFLIGAIVIAENRRFTSAILFADFDLIETVKEKFFFKGTKQEFLSSKILYDFIDKKILHLNQNLNHWESIQKFYIAKEEISIESGEITPSMKLKRGLLERKYQKIIDDFYQE